ncbi:hypothetical protein H6789_02455 [Candidatus Nomurabacteria bacterium]|nr:hypothetical protein [Candidatus Kaiserbacteria bacterium]MCB9815319.1 hypothetical protein [Candidatus Nomurabacteria bacterium]MCB9819542.1 hypothetical protein [Candidatus Nomurabacteria bacterium]
MIRFYSLFITDDDLLASPYVRRFNFFHDITLHRGETETVNFLLQTPLTSEQSKQLNIISDPSSINVLDVETKSFRHQSLVTVTLVAKEVGSIKIGLAFPQSASLHRERMQKLPSPLVSVPCSKIHNEAMHSVSPSLTTVQ